jgi:hypothetical protein
VGIAVVCAAPTATHTTLYRPGRPPLAQGLAPSPSMPMQKLRHHHVGQRLIFCAGIDGLVCCRLQSVQAPSRIASHLARCHAGPQSTREDTCVVRPRPHRHIGYPNFVAR